MAFLGVEVGLEDQSAARHVLVLADHPFQMLLQQIGIVEVALDHVHIVDGSHIDIGEHAADLLIGMEDDALIACLGLMRHRVLCDQIDRNHDDRRNHDQHRHDTQAQPVCKRPFLHKNLIISVTTAANIDNFPETSKVFIKII